MIKISINPPNQFTLRLFPTHSLINKKDTYEKLITMYFWKTHQFSYFYITKKTVPKRNGFYF